MLEGEKLKHLWCRLEQRFFGLVLLTFSKSLKEHLGQVLLVMSVQPGKQLLIKLKRVSCRARIPNSKRVLGSITSGVERLKWAKRGKWTTV
mgnify:FL=1